MSEKITEANWIDQLLVHGSGWGEDPSRTPVVNISLHSEDGERLSQHLAIVKPGIGLTTGVIPPDSGEVRIHSESSSVPGQSFWMRLPFVSLRSGRYATETGYALIEFAGFAGDDEFRDTEWVFPNLIP